MTTIAYPYIFNGTGIKYHHMITDYEATMRYVLPGETWRSSELKTKNRKFIVALQKYIPVGQGCFKLNQ